MAKIIRRRKFDPVRQRTRRSRHRRRQPSAAGNVRHLYTSCVSAQVPTTFSFLFYDYGEDAAERRAPYRAEHLGLATASHADGQMVLAGAFADPLDGAALVFRTREAAEAFVKVDPYVASGLVTGWRIREWTVVIGGD